MLREPRKRVLSTNPICRYASGLVSKRCNLKGRAYRNATSFMRLARRRAALDDAVSKHMTAPVVTTDEDECVHVAMEKMTVRRCRHLDEKLVGIVSIGDPVKHRLEQIEHEYQAMREYIATA
jgi:CBS domain-containing protein